LRAIRTVRARAKEWSVDPTRVGIIGFSAGGEVAALAGTRFDAGQDSSTDAVERQSSRPDFMLLIYPGVRPESLTIPKDASPAFIAQAADDTAATPERTTAIYLALRKAGIPAELAHLWSGRPRLRNARSSDAGVELARARGSVDGGLGFLEEALSFQNHQRHRLLRRLRDR
jgi:endo-1,4-beta-xylanase